MLPLPRGTMTTHLMTTHPMTRRQDHDPVDVHAGGLSVEELALLWRLALGLQQCNSAAEAEAVVLGVTAGISASAAMQRAITETIAPALDAIRDRERLADLALCDPLTGLFNRRFMEEEFGRQLEQMARLGQPMAVAMLDLDRFRDYNEGHGHLAGDLVLRSLALLLQGFRRESDVPCRYGGEEFVLIMPNATAAKSAAA